MEIQATCHNCDLNQNLTISPVTRLMMCRPCKQLVSADASHYRGLESPTCPTCSRTELSNVQRFGTPVRYPFNIDRCWCPSCLQDLLKIQSVTMISWDEDLMPRWEAGDVIHCRVTAPNQGISSRSKKVQLLDCPLECLNHWGEARLIDQSTAVWLAKFPELNLEGLHWLQFNLDDLPWLRIDLDAMRIAMNSGQFQMAWDCLVEPRLEMLTRTELKEAVDRGGVLCSLNVCEVGQLVEVLGANGPQACPIRAMWSASQQAWKDWDECEITLDTGDCYHPLFASTQQLHRLLWKGPGIEGELVFPPTSMQLWVTLQLANSVEKADFELFDLAREICLALTVPAEVSGAETLLRLADLLPDEGDRVGVYARQLLLEKAARL